MLKCVCVWGGVYREEEEAEGEPVNVRQGDEEESEMMACDQKRGCKDAKRSDFTLISNHPRFNCDSCWLLKPSAWQGKKLKLSV